MNKALLLRFGALSCVSAAAAVGGTALSQPEAPALMAVAFHEPVLKPSVVAKVSSPVEVDTALWKAAYAPPVVQTVVGAAPPNPWRFVGVIGDGPSAKAVFTAPGDAMQTLFVKAGETLPDGRTVAAVTNSQVQFAAYQPPDASASSTDPSGTRPGVSQASLTGIPAEILSLFQGSPVVTQNGLALAEVTDRSSSRGAPS